MAASILHPDPLPGTRLVAGKPYIFDLDAMRDWNALAAKMDAPADLAALSDHELTSLFYRALRIDGLSSGLDPDLMRRVAAERCVRGLNSAEAA